MEIIKINTTDKTKTIPGSDSFSRSEESDMSLSDDPVIPAETLPKDSTLNPKKGKNTFDRYYWSFRSDQSFDAKRLKFERAIDYCKKHNLGSKAKLRRLKMKIDRWSVENERDVEAMVSDYELLLDLIEEFENQK
ncbi:MAG: hypothetical protein MAG458_01792 [Nitrosopumilus sp.]|nr:hypothetical protein [Nitrosopumilus sp.]